MCNKSIHDTSITTYLSLSWMFVFISGTVPLLGDQNWEGGVLIYSIPEQLIPRGSAVDSDIYFFFLE
jgi:hypothetical protein